MATAARVPFMSVDEYLRSSFEPDADYVDGLIEERNLGEFDHGDLQWAVLQAINALSPQLGIRARPEIRVQVTPTRFRVPDVCVMRGDWQRTPIVMAPPLLCVEVLSPRDRLTQMVRRCDDYLRMGVPEVWILDPVKSVCTVLTSQGTREQSGGFLALPETATNVDLDQVFSVLDMG